MTGNNGSRGMFSAFTGLIHALSVFFVLGAAFVIGCVADFMEHPWEWIRGSLPAVFIFVFFAVMIRANRKNKERR